MAPRATPGYLAAGKRYARQYQTKAKQAEQYGMHDHAADLRQSAADIQRQMAQDIAADQAEARAHAAETARLVAKLRQELGE